MDPQGLLAPVNTGFKGLRCGAGRSDCKAAGLQGRRRQMLPWLGNCCPSSRVGPEEAGEGVRAPTSPAGALEDLTMLSHSTNFTPAHHGSVTVQLSLSLCSLVPLRQGSPQGRSPSLLRQPHARNLAEWPVRTICSRDSGSTDMIAGAVSFQTREKDSRLQRRVAASHGSGADH